MQICRGNFERQLTNTILKGNVEREFVRQSGWGEPGGTRLGEPLGAHDNPPPLDIEQEPL